MKRFKKYLALVSIVLLFASCSVISDVAAFDSGTSTSSANFKYVKTVKGEATSTYLLGLGGSNHSQKAMDELKKNANLQANQALSNVSVVKTVKYSLFPTRKVTITADVIEFIP